MTKTLAKAYNTIHDYRTHITYALIGACILMVLLYAINVYKVISNTVALQKVQSQSVALQSDVEILDSKYLGLTNKITPDTLAAHGFIQGKVSAYISRNASLGRVALGGHEL